MNPLVQPDPGLFIWTIITFLGLLWALKKLAWGPLLEALETRQNAIRKSLDDAQQAKTELERLHVESAQILQRARVDAEAIITQSRSDGDRLREEIRARARTEADHIVKHAERQIQLETSRALGTIRRGAVDLSVMIASKIIQRNLSKADNEKLIDEALKQAEGRRKRMRLRVENPGSGLGANLTCIRHYRDPSSRRRRLSQGGAV